MNTGNYKFDDHKIFTKNEEKQLFEIYHTTTSQSIKDQIRGKIITHNMKFAARAAIAYRAKYPHVHLDDLKGYAMDGLIESVDKFDHTRGTKFISFAVWWIKNSIIKSVQSNESLIRHPGNIHTKLQERITNKEMTEEDLLMVETIRGGLSMSKPVNGSDGGQNDHKTLGDSIRDEQDESTIMGDIDIKIIRAKLNSVLADLDERPRKILEEAFGLKTGECRTIRAIAKDLDMSHENVRYIRDKAMRDIKRKVKSLC